MDGATPLLCHATVLSFGGLAPALSANLDHDAAFGVWRDGISSGKVEWQKAEWLKSKKQESEPVEVG